MAIDETLKEKMIQAFLGGNKEEALRLSQELDIQIVEEQRREHIGTNGHNHKHAGWHTACAAEV